MYILFSRLCAIPFVIIIFDLMNQFQSSESINWHWFMWHILKLFLFIFYYVFRLCV